MTINAHELLRVLRILGVELRAEGGKLRWRPRDAVLSATREAILKCKAELLAILTDPSVATVNSRPARVASLTQAANTDSWPDADADELILWFNTAELPLEPFALAPWRRVENPALFYQTLREDLARGPARPHVHHRGVLENIRLLHQRFGNGHGLEKTTLLHQLPHGQSPEVKWL